MKNVSVPNRRQLSKAYGALQLKGHTVTPPQIVLWSQWSRLDARLAQILVEFLHLQFKNINPLDLWRENQNAETPQALPVICEFVTLRIQKDSQVAKLFSAWCRACVGDVRPAPPQLFFVPEGIPNQSRILKEVGDTLRPYAKWGFFSNEWIGEEKRPVSKIYPTLMNAHSRLSRLRELLKIKSVITVDDYMDACSGRIHRRMAERDLKSSPLVLPFGFTRNRIYKKI